MSARNVGMLCIGLALSAFGLLALPPRPTAAEPVAPAPTTGRYQVVRLAQFAPSERQDGTSSARNDRIAVIDTMTGQCWTTSDEKGNEWRDLGSPVKAQK